MQPRGLKYIKPLPPVSQRPRLTKDESGFIVTCPPADRILATINLNNWRARLQFHNHLKKMGVMEALIRAKIEEGDTVFLGGYEFTWE